MRTAERFRKSGMLEETDLIDEQLQLVGFQLISEPIKFFEIPRNTHSNIGELFVSYVHLDKQGFLDTEEPRIYGVTSRPNTTQGHLKSEIRSPQVHVFTEDLAFKRRLLTDYGRTSSEAVGVSLMPEVFIPEYAQDRAVHLRALETEVQQSHGPNSAQKKKIAEELGHAIRFLDNHIQG